MINQFGIITNKDTHGRYAVIHTEGYVNNLAGEKIGEVANGLIAEGYMRLVINMEKSTVINSIGISILIEIIEKMRRHFPLPAQRILKFAGVTLDNV